MRTRSRNKLSRLSACTLCTRISKEMRIFSPIRHTRSVSEHRGVCAARKPNRLAMRINCVVSRLVPSATSAQMATTLLNSGETERNRQSAWSEVSTRRVRRLAQVSEAPSAPKRGICSFHKWRLMIRSPAFNRVPSDSITARSRRPIWIRKMQRGSLVYSSTDPSRRNRASRAATANASQRDRDADVYAPSQPSALSRSSTQERSTFPAMVAALVFSSARSLALAAA